MPKIGQSPASAGYLRLPEAFPSSESSVSLAPSGQTIQQSSAPSRTSSPSWLSSLSRKPSSANMAAGSPVSSYKVLFAPEFLARRYDAFSSLDNARSRVGVNSRTSNVSGIEFTRFSDDDEEGLESTVSSPAKREPSGTAVVKRAALPEMEKPAPTSSEQRDARIREKIAENPEIQTLYRGAYYLFHIKNFHPAELAELAVRVSYHAQFGLPCIYRSSKAGRETTIKKMAALLEREMPDGERRAVKAQCLEHAAGCVRKLGKKPSMAAVAAAKFAGVFHVLSERERKLNLLADLLDEFGVSVTGIQDATQEIYGVNENFNKQHNKRMQEAGGNMPLGQELLHSLEQHKEKFKALVSLCDELYWDRITGGEPLAVQMDSSDDPYEKTYKALGRVSMTLDRLNAGNPNAQEELEKELSSVAPEVRASFDAIGLTLAE